MKTTITATLVFFSAALLAQTVRFENLSSFDKLIVAGDVEHIKVKRHHGERPQVSVEGVPKENIATKIEAGVLYLNISGTKAKEVVVYNDNLHRIETDEEVAIAGVEVMGSKGKYLITDFHHGHGPVARHVDINLPRIDIDLPGIAIDIPEIDFDFDYNYDYDFDHDFDIDVDWDEGDWHFSWNWAEHKEEIRHISREVKEEMKRAMEEVKREIKNRRKE